MKTLFEELGFQNFQQNKEESYFLASYSEAKFDVNVYFDKDRGFINMQVEKDQLKKELLPSLSIFDPKKITEILFHTCYIKNFLPILHLKITQLHTQNV